MKKLNVLYLFGITTSIIIISYFICSHNIKLSDKGIIGESNYIRQSNEINIPNNLNGISYESLKIQIEKSGLNINRILGIVGILISSLVYCIIISKENGLFFFKQTKKNLSHSFRQQGEAND